MLRLLLDLGSPTLSRALFNLCCLGGPDGLGVASSGQTTLLQHYCNLSQPLPPLSNRLAMTRLQIISTLYHFDNDNYAQHKSLIYDSLMLTIQYLQYKVFKLYHCSYRT